MTNWINTVSRDHVERGVRGRFTQANHGKPHMLKKMAKGDWIGFYSPKTVYPDGEPLQAFTAIGRVADDEPYQPEMSPDFTRGVAMSICWMAPRLPFARCSTSWTSSRTRRAGGTNSASVCSRSAITTST